MYSHELYEGLSSAVVEGVEGVLVKPFSWRMEIILPSGLRWHFETMKRGSTVIGLSGKSTGHPAAKTRVVIRKDGTCSFDKAVKAIRQSGVEHQARQDAATQRAQAERDTLEEIKRTLPSGLSLEPTQEWSKTHFRVKCEDAPNLRMTVQDHKVTVTTEWHQSGFKMELTVPTTYAWVACQMVYDAARKHKGLRVRC